MKYHWPQRKHNGASEDGKNAVQPCTIELGFILSDLTTSYKRIADHCSNIAVCLIQADNDEYERHSYLNSLKEEDNQQFREQFEEYGKEYALPARIKGTPKVDMRARMTAG